MKHRVIVRFSSQGAFDLTKISRRFKLLNGIITERKSYNKNKSILFRNAWFILIGTHLTEIF